MAKQSILPADTGKGSLADALLRQWHGGDDATAAFSVTRRSVDAGELARQAVKRSTAKKQIQKG